VLVPFEPRAVIQRRLLSGCDRADFDSCHFGVDEEAERILQLVPLHQPVKGSLTQFR
jgi:hypothetical protein